MPDAEDTSEGGATAPVLSGAEVTAPEGPGPSIGARLATGWPWLVAAVISLVPVVRMWWWIRTGTHVQFADYWEMIDKLIGADGEVRWAAVTKFHAQHLLTLPQIIYVGNIELFGGSNVSLGYLVLVVVLVQVAIIWRWLADLGEVPTAGRAALAALVTSLLLWPHGAWNFLRAMSGAAWLVANLLAVVAVHLVSRRRYALAAGTAAAATVTYGTGILVWPVLILAMVLQRPARRVLVALPLAAAAGMGAYFVHRSNAAPVDLPRPGPVALVENSLALLGSPFTSRPGLAVLLGGVVSVVLVVAALAVVRRSMNDALPFVYLGVFGLLNAVQIGYGRNGLPAGLAAFEASRYTSIPALVWACAAVLVARCVAAGAPVLGGSRGRVRHVARWLVPVVVLLVVVAALVVPFTGTEQVAATRGLYPRLGGLADAQRVQVSAGRQWWAMLPQPDVDARLELLGHHPFDGRHHADCGLLGRPFLEEAQESAEAAERAVRPGMPKGVEVGGRFPLDEADVACVIVVDLGGRVVGAGRAQEPEAGGTGTQVLAYAPADAVLATLAVRTEDGRWLAAPISSPTGAADGAADLEPPGGGG